MTGTGAMVPASSWLSYLLEKEHIFHHCNIKGENLGQKTETKGEKISASKLLDDTINLKI